ncbi:MAG: hypothetical protein AAGK04_09105 [Planctomycetota bacterium]
MRRSAIILAMVIAALGARAQDASMVHELMHEPITEIARGVVSEVIIPADRLEAAGIDGLCAAVRQEAEAPILVRVHPIGDPNDGLRPHRVLVFAAVAGVHDLAEALETPDGRSAAATLGPIPVEVVSDLPEHAGASLFPGERYPVRLAGWYTPLVWSLAMGWLVVPAVVIAHRVLRARPPVDEAEPVPEPTLADQLRPLIAAATDGSISVSEQARLELLLYRSWRARLGLAGAPLPEAIARLRTDADAGELLLAVERWLHRPSMPDTRATPDEVTRLLAPYAQRPAMSAGEDCERPHAFGRTSTG